MTQEDKYDDKKGKRKEERQNVDCREPRTWPEERPSGIIISAQIVDRYIIYLFFLALTKKDEANEESGAASKVQQRIPLTTHHAPA